ncbi:U-box domain-containing protein 62-like [Bidens hawaiensis]|uniref:U-box domain-containing protein 62-like n=1 Tax=Bidens hawaiensis TaxID=980011 RepID=UPI00404B7DB2
MGSEETTALALSHQIIFHPHPPNNNNNHNHQRRYSEFRQSILTSALHNSDDSSDQDDDDLNDVKSSSIENHQPEQIQYPNAIALVDRDGELYYLHGTEGSGSGLKDTVVENGCGFSGRKDESGDSLRSILSDPFTGALMDDAMILPCGHSFGSGGIQHVMKAKACYTCSHHVTEASAAPNLSLRSAVLAFRKEEESQVHHASKRRRERLDQDRINYNDLMDTPRGKGLQFPFSVADRVIIKGNKRTPERFFGCEAVVTTQCLNGWYVVKTLDTAESIKLQYRSLAKVSDSSSHPSSSKMAPKWL